MKLNDFEAHPLWDQMREVQGLTARIRDENDGRDIDVIDELDTRVAQLEASYKTRRRLASLMVPSQLDGMQGTYQYFRDALTNVLANPDVRTRQQYLNQAFQYAQQGSAAQGSWPAASPTIAEERLEVAVVDALLERASSIDDYVRQRIESIESEVSSTDTRTVAVTAAIAQAETDLAELVRQAKAAVESERARIGAVIDDGNSKIAGFEGVLEASLKEWKGERTQMFETYLAKLRGEQESLLAGAKSEYDELSRTITDYQTLVQADSADRLAKHYEEEAGSASSSGWKATIAGFILLILGAVPLLIIVIQPLLTAIFGWEFKAPDWMSIVARAGVAAVFVGAATVAIKIGSGFLKRSADYKRLAMELRTMGPFLSGVEERELVDQARLDLVSRAFGQAYVPQKDERLEEAIPVTVLQQLLTLLTRTVSK